MSFRMRVLVAGALLSSPAASWAQEPGKALLTLQGYGLNFTGVGRGRSGDLEIGIERWSSDQEHDRLRAALAEGGVPALTRALPAAPRVGYVRAQGGHTLAVKYAREFPLPDGARRVLLVTDRLDVPADGTNPRADVHDFLVAEIRLDKDGKGQGRTAGPEQLHYSKEAGTLDVDRKGAMPVWIEKLRVVAPKPAQPRP